LEHRDEISPDEDLVNKWRLAKGDLIVAVNGRGKISHAIPATLTILKDYIRKGVFPYHYEIYGVGFLELQSAFRTPMKAKCSSVLLEQWGIGESSGYAAGFYLNVRKAIGTYRAGLLGMTLENTERRKRRISVIKERRNTLRAEEIADCFERLIEIMDEERNRISKNN